MKSSNRQRAKIFFWGVRGSVPSFETKKTRYGGNTACISIEFDNKFFICDAGTGIRLLGHKLIKKKSPIFIFISHLHWDHIFGLPFFEPIYQQGRKILVAGPSPKGISFKKELTHILRPPYFPVGMRDWQSQVQWKNLKEGRCVIGDVTVEMQWVDHPDKALGFRFAFPNGRKLIYVTDHDWCGRDKKFFSWIKDADILIHDSQFDRKEYARKKDWGHSAYETVFALALKANVKKLVFFHHDPGMTDHQLEKRLKFCRQKISRSKNKMKCLLAKEGASILLR